jgi:hypothetical protein
MRHLALKMLTATSLLVASANVTAAQTIWLGPTSDKVMPEVDPDYLQLFEDAAPWQRALSHTRVFEMSRWYVATQPEATLRQVFGFFRDHRISLAVIFGFIPVAGCSQDVEGAAHRPDENLLVAKRLKRLGADLTYMTVDEALFFGHYFKGKNACQYPIADLAASFAREARQVRSVFPDAQLIDTEPSSGIPSAVEFGQWLDALDRELGAGAPKVVRFDVQWYRPWQQTIPPVIAVLRQHRLSYGVIFKGTYQDRTDRAYIAAAQQHILDWQATIKEPPDHVLFQNWEHMPMSVLPETSPGTLPFLLNWYCEQTNVPGGCR